MIRRGEIWWASLGAPTGSGPGYRRPVLVVQADGFNRSAIRTIVVVGITSNPRLAQAPGNVRLGKRASGLSRDSVVNVSQVLTVDRSLLAGRVRTLPKAELTAVEAGLKRVLGL